MSGETSIKFDDVQLLSVSAAVGSDNQRRLVLTVRLEPDHNFEPTNLALSVEQFARLREDLNTLFEHSPLLRGAGGNGLYNHYVAVVDQKPNPKA